MVSKVTGCLVVLIVILPARTPQVEQLILRYGRQRGGTGLIAARRSRVAEDCSAALWARSAAGWLGDREDPPTTSGGLSGLRG